MKPSKELKYKGVPPQIADFIENNLGIGKGKGKVKGNPLKDSDIQAAFPNIDPADYIDVMGEAYTEFMQRRVADGSAISDNPPPPAPVVAPTLIPVLDDKGNPVLDGNGNPVMAPAPIPAPAPTPEQMDPAVTDSSQTPDYVPPVNPLPESTPTTPSTGGNN